jgi:integrase
VATLRVKQRGGEPRFYVRWREGSRFIEKALGLAWVVPSGDPESKRNAAGVEIGERVGEWIERKGRPASGYLSPRQASASVAEAQMRHRAEQEASVGLTPAQRKAQRLRERISQLEAEVDRLEGDQVPTFADAAEAWYVHRRDVKRLKPSSLRDYRQALDGRILPTLGRLKLREVDERAIVRFRDALAAERKTVNGQEVAALTPRTVNKLLVLVDGILGHACRSEGLGGFGLASNPAQAVEKVSDRRVDTTDYLSMAEVALVVDALARGKHRPATEADSEEEIEAAARRMENARDAAAVSIAGFAGLRLGEIIALRWADVSFAEDRITVRRSVVRGHEDTPKGKRARDVPMAEPVAQALAKLQSEIREYAKAAGIPVPDDREGYVLVGRTGERIDGDNLRKRYAAASKAIGLRAVKFHGLRHTFVTAAREGFGVDRVQAMAGHQDAQTAQRYAHPKSRSTDAKLLTDILAAEVAASALA